MARQNSALEFNTFTKGIITEASPLTFPEGASIDEQNFEINRDGSRVRRLGLDFEDNHTLRSPGQINELSGEIVCTTFKWSNTGEPGKEITVVQLSKLLLFFDTSVEPLSSNSAFIDEWEIVDPDNINTPVQFSYANIGEKLVIASGKKELEIFSFELGGIQRSIDSIRVRDFWGVEDNDPGQNDIDLRDPSNIESRPTTEFDEHIYNLRNQTWALPKKNERDNKSRDPINIFFTAEGSSDPDEVGFFPANSDSVLLGLFPNPEDTEDPVGDRFWQTAVRDNTIGKAEAPRGFFIIDLMERSKSRLEEYNNLISNKYTDSGIPFYDIGGLPEDKTEGGPSRITSFAGRVWFAGFNGVSVGGDKYSPKLKSHIAFSKLVKSDSDITRCYQEADPTSKEPDIVDTDGGTVYIPEASNIQRLETLGSALIVFGENGVWSISGGSDFGFTATSFRVDKVSDSGLVGPYSIVVVEGGIFYWSQDGIYFLSGTEMGTFQTQNITENSIQALFNDIGYLEKQFSRGFFDKFDRKVRWLYNTRKNSVGPVKELILDLNLQAFYVNNIEKTSDGWPIPMAIAEVPPYKAGESVSNVLVNGDQVQVNSEDVTITTTTRDNSVRSIKYVTLTSTLGVTFSEYNNSNFLDWETYDSTGVDADAYLITGYAPGQDFQRNKQVPYLTMHFIRTEDGFEDIGGDLFPTNESSCKVQARWDWANSANSNRWGREFQAYRYKRVYIPADVNDPYDTGFETIVTKNKIRGKGRVISFLMKTEPAKDCRLLGWSMILGVSGNV